VTSKYQFNKLALLFLFFSCFPAIHLNYPQLHRGVTARIMAETLWRLAKWSIRRPNCLSRRRVFGRRVMSHSATVEDIERRHAPVQLPPFSCFMLDAGLRRHDKGIFDFLECVTFRLCASLARNDEI